jgi:hypothetical protein
MMHRFERFTRRSGNAMSNLIPEAGVFSCRMTHIGHAGSLSTLPRSQGCLREPISSHPANSDAHRYGVPFTACRGSTRRRWLYPIHRSRIDPWHALRSGYIGCCMERPGAFALCVATSPIAALVALGCGRIPRESDKESWPNRVR